MAEWLFTWIGKTDLDASRDVKDKGLGPIAQAVTKRHFDEIHLLNDYPSHEANDYLAWLKKHSSSKIIVHQTKLPSPIDYEAIYRFADRTITANVSRNKKASLTYHLSPGTPAMAAVWIILAKSTHPARLIQSSIKMGLTDVSLPFDISAEYIPPSDQADTKLQDLGGGATPIIAGFDNIIYRSHAMTESISLAQKIAPRDIPLLIHGESGTGKELFAKAVHGGSPRHDKPFIAVNCGALPETLVESELFGHKKGAFTGADKDKAGYFEVAHGGTLFLDEIGEMPLSAQVKLLRVLQEKKITRLGDTREIPIDVRLICATNRDLMAEVVANRFREDLFYRIGVIILKIPPLRDRKGDVSLLVDHFLKAINREFATTPGVKDKKISPGAKNLLLHHPWRGNVRELQNTLMRACFYSEEPGISENDVKRSLLDSGSDSNVSRNTLPEEIPEDFHLHALLDALTKNYVELAVKQAQGSKSRAAKLLGLKNYQTLTNWMGKYGLR